ncbi:MAG: hypothetical protein CMF75_08345, partial [Maricaulis sp.]|nr:hypothetical protein [Maricaulis sp.]
MICEVRQYPTFDKSGFYAGMNADLVEKEGRGYKARMRVAGVSQADAQAALGWSQTKVSRFVNGERKRVGMEERLTFERWLEQVERK